uniref:NRPD902 n=1 Tax=Arundo donax TaxID=35708 RepID=A0A0A8YF67_ARUDO
MSIVQRQAYGLVQSSYFHGLSPCEELGTCYFHKRRNFPLKTVGRTWNSVQEFNGHLGGCGYML